mgnify:FL=1
METGRFEVNEVSDEVMNIAVQIVEDDEIKSVTRICERYDQDDENIRKYDVYKIKTGNSERILKKVSEREVMNYENYLQGRNFNVPEYYGCYNDGKNS